jgi:hypothetical protein
MHSGNLVRTMIAYPLKIDPREVFVSPSIYIRKHASLYPRRYLTGMGEGGGEARRRTVGGVHKKYDPPLSPPFRIAM